MLGGGIDCVEDLVVMLSVYVLFPCPGYKVHRKKEQYQWCRASIDELVLGTSRHYHEVSTFDILVFTSNGGFARPRGEGQGLVNGVDLRETAVSLWIAALRRLKLASKKPEQTSSPIWPSTGTVMSTTCEYSPVHSTLRNSPDFDGKAEVISGKQTISCLGGPEGILGSLAERVADCENALVAEAETTRFEDILRSVLGIAVLSIFRKRRRVE